MTTIRKHLDYWWEVKRVVDGEVKTTTCCCKGAGLTANECRLASGNKSRCACYCHSKKRKKYGPDWRLELSSDFIHKGLSQ